MDCLRRSSGGIRNCSIYGSSQSKRCTDIGLDLRLYDKMRKKTRNVDFRIFCLRKLLSPGPGHISGLISRFSGFSGKFLSVLDAL